LVPFSKPVSTGGKVQSAHLQSAAGTELLEVEKCCIAPVEQSLGLCDEL
jgi:hypothetical protein